MVFSSTSFLFVFLPLFLGAYFMTPHARRNGLIVLASFVFYGFWRVDFALLLLAMMLFTYGVSLALIHATTHKKRILWTGIGVNLATLAYFKYTNFGIESFNLLLEKLSLPTFDTLSILLPIGISFYIFHCLSYLIDLYRKDAEPAESFIQFAAFISMFPHLVAGPVLKFKDMADQMRHPMPGFDDFNAGCVRFMTGFTKKVLIADSIAPLADTIFALPEPTMTEAWLGALAYGMQIYFDFSGYSDMAIGLARMMGFRFIENFDRPYTSRSVSDFWRRWHISLSTWLRDYVYIPLGGNRHGLLRTCLNILCVMTLCGLWHGASMNFLLWGALFGVVMVLERLVPLRLPATLTTITTFVTVTALWVLFRSEDIDHAGQIYGAMLSGEGGFGEALYWQIRWLSAAALALACYITLIHPHIRAFITPGPVLARQAFLSAAFILAVIKLNAQSYTPFLYFQF